MIIYKRLGTTRVRANRQPTKVGEVQKATVVSEQIAFAVDLDFDLLNALARKAAGNKSRKSRVGPITVEVLKVESIT